MTYFLPPPAGPHLLKSLQLLQIAQPAGRECSKEESEEEHSGSEVRDVKGHMPSIQPNTARVFPSVPSLILICISVKFYGNEKGPAKPAAYLVFWWMLGAGLEGARLSPLPLHHLFFPQDMRPRLV